MEEVIDTESIEYWTKNSAFGIDYDYKGKPDYIKAQKFWDSKKNALLDIYKDNSEVKLFIHSITVLDFYEIDYSFTVSLIVKYRQKNKVLLMHEVDKNDSYQYSHFFVCLIFEPFSTIRKQITIYDYEWWEKNCYNLDENDTEGDLDRKLYEGFRDIMGWDELKQGDLSVVFTVLFEFFSDRMKIEF